MGDDIVPGSVHDLRRRWKPHKTRLSAGTDGHPTVIRFHRATTWLQRVEQIEASEDQDVALTCQWIAFNALYGQWDERAREPKPDRQSWRAFMDRVLAIDNGGHMASMLTEHKKLVMSILDDRYLKPISGNTRRRRRRSRPHGTSVRRRPGTSRSGGPWCWRASWSGCTCCGASSFTGRRATTVD